MRIEKLFLVVVLGLILGACAMGKDALSKMSPGERTFAEKVDQVQRGMTKEQVVAILGPEYRERNWMLIWEPTGSGANQVRVYFIKGTVHNVRWTKLGDGAFVYEPLNDR